MNNFRSCVFLTISALLFACSSPPELTAERPLIESKNKTFSNAERLPENLWASFNNAFPGISIETNYGNVYVENTYVSALGYWCVAFELENTTTTGSNQEKSLEKQPQSDFYGQNRRACKANDTWFFVSPLMNYTYTGAN